MGGGVLVLREEEFENSMEGSGGGTFFPVPPPICSDAKSGSGMTSKHITFALPNESINHVSVSGVSQAYDISLSKKRGKIP